MNHLPTLLPPPFYSYILTLTVSLSYKSARLFGNNVDGKREREREKHDGKITKTIRRSVYISLRGEMMLTVKTHDSRPKDLYEIGIYPSLKSRCVR